MNRELKLSFPRFEDIPVSTKTFVIETNIKFNIKKLFDFLPITDYIIVPKRRGRKKKDVLPDPNGEIADGSIITLELVNDLRGVSLKKKKKKIDKSVNYFRNSLTVVMFIDGKKINFKINRNGKFQMTGVKKDSQAEECVKYIWSYIKDYPDCYELEDEVLEAYFIPAMRNINFSLGFVLDREKLDEYINTSTRYCSLLETSIGYTGVNIKIPILKDVSEIKIGKMEYKEGDWYPSYKVDYKDCLKLHTPKERQKKMEKDYFNTLLVFHSGKVIMSSLCEEFARDTYYEFIEIVLNNYEKFQERME